MAETVEKKKKKRKRTEEDSDIRKKKQKLQTPPQSTGLTSIKITSITTPQGPPPVISMECGPG